MLFTEDKISALRERVALYMGGKRFAHTLGVENMAVRLGEIFMPERVSELRVAAILHDVSKEFDIDEQLSLINLCNRIDKKQRCVPQALHSFSAVAVILNDFSEYASDDILDAVMCHTLGDENMSLFSEIIFLSDYIEDGREYLESAHVRTVLFDELGCSLSFEDKIRALHRATVLSIDLTLKSLEKRGLLPDERSIKTKKAFEALI